MQKLTPYIVPICYRYWFCVIKNVGHGGKFVETHKSTVNLIMHALSYSHL